MNHKIHYDSLMTNHDYDRGSCYCTDFAIGYTGIVHESLIFSDTGKITLLPALPKTGFDSGKITGVRTRTRATVTSLEWNGESFAAATIQSDIDQKITVTCGLTGESREVACKAGESVRLDFTL